MRGVYAAGSDSEKWKVNDFDATNRRNSLRRKNETNRSEENGLRRKNAVTLIESFYPYPVAEGR
jgi:hypothetical protein